MLHPYCRLLSSNWNSSWLLWNFCLHPPFLQNPSLVSWSPSTEGWDQLKFVGGLPACLSWPPFPPLSTQPNTKALDPNTCESDGFCKYNKTIFNMKSDLMVVHTFLVKKKKGTSSPSKLLWFWPSPKLSWIRMPFSGVMNNDTTITSTWK